MKTALFLVISFWIQSAHVWSRTQNVLIPYLDGDKWGYSDTAGHVIIPPKWRTADFFKNGRADVHTEQGYGVINVSGKYIVPPERKWNGRSYSSLVGAYYNAVGKNGKYGIIDSNNRELLPCLYDQTDPGNGFKASGYFIWDRYYNKYIAKVSKNGKFGVIDSLNNVLIPFEYDGIEIDRKSIWASPKYFVVQKGSLMGLIDMQNRIVIPAQYYNIWLDAENPNQIMLFRYRTTVIADTTGRIVVDIPNYRVSFPRFGLIPVENTEGKHGLMNAKQELVIPCIYLGVGLTHDTIVISRWSNDSAEHKEQLFQYLDVRTYKPISDWINYAERVKLPPQSRDHERPVDKRLQFHMQMRIQGKDLYAYKKDSILWAAVDWPRGPNWYRTVRGAADNDTVAQYSAVLDTNGNYIIPPRKTNLEIQVLNSSDSLVQLTTVGKDSFAVADYQLRLVFPFQRFPVSAAFYQNKNFYAVLQHDRPEWVSSHGMHGGSPYQAHNYTYHLVNAKGAPVNALKDYTLHWFTDSNGYRIDGKRFGNDRDDGFEAAFRGYFMAEDSNGNTGVVDIRGKTQLQSISFKYRQMKRIGPEVFLVDNYRPKPRRDSYLEDLLSLPEPQTEPDMRVSRGLPYLVDQNNRVLLDSLTVESAELITTPYPSYSISLKRPKKNFSRYDISFYMSRKGRGYFRRLPTW